MISEPLINYEIQNPYGHTTLNNAYSYHAEDNMPFLKSVFSQKTPMFSSAYGVLANTIEQFYKGVYIELYKIKKDMPKASHTELYHLHTYDGIVSKIQKTIPIFNDKEYKNIKKQAGEIAKGYTSSRYTAIYEYKDFQRDYARFMNQRERLYRALDIEKAKYENKMAKRSKKQSKKEAEEDFEIE